MIRDNYKTIVENIERAKAKAGISGSVRVMAVTKTVPVEKIVQAVSCGIELLGENRVQEFLSKREDYPQSAEVHFIGALQSNKIKQIIGKVSMIHSVADIKTAREISRLSLLNGLKTDILIQVNIGGELTKNGVSPEELNILAEQTAELPGIKLRGLMTIPPVGDSARYFEDMRKLYDGIKAEYDGIDTLSMGMSGDYAEAVMYGATIVRVGTALFGTRF